jgi:type IV secretion system protein VirD4
MTPDEVRMLDNQYAILFIRGERPILDYKYDILSHPNIDLSADGEGKKYDHGKIEFSGFGVEIVDIAEHPDLNLDEIPRLDEYYAGIYAYDEDETEELLNFLKNLLESEEHETKKNKAVDGGTDGGSAH